ncbi:MAG: glutamine-hydrolyzing carbamoyl-phosphate synthase small subunit [Phycisphaerales bacterium]|nr:glutamine-hydrolyzing carbamoyl-phosphate synthase small subunit [Phycisphaerales bacterium]
MMPRNNTKPARLALSSGIVLTGDAFGAVGKGIISTGEVVFNTAMCGYQESLTDPSYMGQILIQTQPMIGNTGVNTIDTESSKVQVSGFGVHEYNSNWSNFRANNSLDEYLDQAGVLGISGIDTRSITRSLRSSGVVQGVLTDNSELTDLELVTMAQQVKSMSGQNLAQEAGRDSTLQWTENLGEWGGGNSSSLDEDHRPHVLVMDFGIKSNIARHLAAVGCDVEIIPQSTSADQIKQRIASSEVQGLFLSNGPGDPDAINQTIDMLKELIESPESENTPIYGICLGHQLLSLAIGAKTYKLPFGHRGANHPVHDLETGRVHITSQNHGFAVDQDSVIKAGGQVTHVHLNDGTVAGFRIPNKPVAAVQFHPEASPGPHDASYFFKEFADRIKSTLDDSIGI